MFQQVSPRSGHLGSPGFQGALRVDSQSEVDHDTEAGSGDAKRRSISLWETQDL